MNSETISLITDFNNTLVSLASNVAMVCPDSMIATNLAMIKKQIAKKQNFNKFIDVFCIKVLQYKDQIDTGDESFFMNKDYKSDLQDQNIDILDHVITLKSIWTQLKKENKEIVIVNMQILCELAQQYFNIIVKKKN